jgi:hypothetical protein
MNGDLIKNESLSSTVLGASVSLIEACQDSTSLSGNVGTALYVAPELLTPRGINKYLYTQVSIFKGFKGF